MQTMRDKPLLVIFLIIALFQLFINGGRLNNFLTNPIGFIFLLLAILIALVIHEFCHAWAADQLGDPNPRLAGRLSLNPKRHLDPVGTLLIIFTGYGWGKPVEFDPYNFKDPDKDGALVAAAGPVSNLLLAVICALVLRFVPINLNSTILLTLYSFLYVLFSVNVTLAIFNLLPIYPLDGHHILRALLPTDLRHGYDRFNHSVGIIVAFLLILPIFGAAPISSVMTPIIELLQKVLLGT